MNISSAELTAHIQNNVDLDHGADVLPWRIEEWTRVHAQKAMMAIEAFHMSNRSK